MRILLVHNFYQHVGGEDRVFRAELRMLRERGNQVAKYSVHNQRISAMNRVSLAVNVLWSLESRNNVGRLIREHRPQVVHFHNIFPLISTSAYDACRKRGIPIVQTLHNYRLLCPVATFFRNGRVCEDCLGKTPPWPGVLHACYRDSSLETAGVAAMLSLNRLRTSKGDAVDVYIALTEFGRDKFVEGGIPADRLAVKPNFVHPDPGAKGDAGSYAVFAGRLAREKGVGNLLEAWESIPTIPLRIIGAGPLSASVEAAIDRRDESSIKLLGEVTHSDVFQQLKNSRLLVFPSESYEGFPMVLIEAFACGVPVIASNLGAMREIITHGQTGLLFEPGNAEDLATKVLWAWEHPEEMRKMGLEARRTYENEYTEDRNYEQLMNIYAMAIGR